MPQGRWAGEYTDGRTAIVHVVDAVFDGQFLVIRSREGHEISRWNVRDVETEPAGQANRLHLRSRVEDGAALEIFGGPELGAEVASIGIHVGGLPTDQRRRVLFALALVAGIVGMVGLIWILVTPISRAIAEVIPIEYEQALGGQVEQAFAQLHCEREEDRLVLVSLLNRVAGQDHSIPPLHILNIETPNAFALPGGGIVFTRGLLTAAESPDEVAGVLAHEIQHVRQRHVMTSMIRGTLLTTLWAVTVGDYSGLLVIDPATAFQIATLKFSREDEASADHGALEMLDAAGIRRDGLSDFFIRLAGEDGEGPEWLATHPSSIDRAKASQPSGGIDRLTLSPALTATQWEVLWNACDGAGDPESTLSDLIR